MWLQRGPAAAVQPPRAASPSPCETPRSCVADRESDQEDDEEISDDEDPGGTEEVLHRPVVEPLKVPHHHVSATRAAAHKEEAAWSPRRQGLSPENSKNSSNTHEQKWSRAGGSWTWQFSYRRAHTVSCVVTTCKDCGLNSL
jgi:hypothetical protein